jgi:hypothetical protein
VSHPEQFPHASAEPCAVVTELVLLCCSPLHFTSGAVALACCLLSLLEPHQYRIDLAPPEFLAVTPMPRRAAVPSPSHPHVLASLYSRRHLLLRTIVEASPSPCVAMRRSASLLLCCFVVIAPLLAKYLRLRPPITTVKLYNSDGRLMSDGPVGNRRTYGYVRRPTAAVENKKI